MSLAGTGTVWFSNYLPAAELDAPVLDFDGTGAYGEEFRAQLFGGPRGTDEAELMPIGEPVEFGTGRWAGYWEASPEWRRELEGTPDGRAVTLQVRAWMIAGGETFEEAHRSRRQDVRLGASDLLEVTLGTQEEPAVLEGLEAFFLYPAAEVPLFDE